MGPLGWTIIGCGVVGLVLLGWRLGRACDSTKDTDGGRINRAGMPPPDIGA